MIQRHWLSGFLVERAEANVQTQHDTCMLDATVELVVLEPHGIVLLFGCAVGQAKAACLRIAMMRAELSHESAPVFLRVVAGGQWLGSDANLLKSVIVLIHESLLDSNSLNSQ